MYFIMRYKLNSRLKKRFILDYTVDGVVLLDQITLNTHYASCTRQALYIMLLETKDHYSLKKIIKKNNWTGSHLKRYGR